MKRRLLDFTATVSFLLLLAVAAAWARSLFVYDTVTRSNWTPEPLTAEARAWAEPQGISANFIGCGRARGVMVWGGKVTWVNAVQMNVTSRWDEAFEKKYVNRPHWQRETTSPGGSWIARDSIRNDFWGRFGFGRHELKLTSSWYGSFKYTTVPLWPAALALAVLPALRLRRWWRVRSRNRGGLCLSCGYDLRGSVGGRCPECGVATSDPGFRSRLAPGVTGDGRGGDESGVSETARRT